MITLLLFVVGLMVGSFLNVLGLRWRSGKGFGGRSFCVACYKPLRWYELVPVVSYVSQRGKCRGCSTKISWQYPVVELVTALMFVSIVRDSLSLAENLLILAVFSIFIVITIYDVHHKIIPDELVWTGVLGATIYRLIVGGSTLDWVAPLFIFLFFIILWLITRGRAVGLGDAKLGIAIGFLLGAENGFSAVILAFWIGAVVAVGLLLLGKMSLLKGAKGLTMKSEIPFAPFLILGAWISLIFQLDLLHAALF